MKILVLSDIHGNLEALDAVLSDAEKQNWQEIWFLGDLCGYGPDSQSCFQKLQKEKTLFITGNHDLYICGKLGGNYFNPIARHSLILGRDNINSEMIDFLKRQPSHSQYKGSDLVHGSLLNPIESYILDGSDARKNFSLTRKKSIFFGHTHVQEYYRMKKKELSSGRGEDKYTMCFRGDRVLINPGSVGQPRDSDNRAAWGILDTKEKSFTFHRTIYDFKMTQGKMKKRGYPQILINRLEWGT